MHTMIELQVRGLEWRWGAITEDVIDLISRTITSHDMLVARTDKLTLVSHVGCMTEVMEVK